MYDCSVPTFSRPRNFLILNIDVVIHRQLPESDQKTNYVLEHFPSFNLVIYVSTQSEFQGAERDIPGLVKV